MTETVETAELPAYPLARECPYRPSTGYAELREPGPVRKVLLFSERPVWLITGNAEAKAFLTDPRISSDRRHPNFPVMMPGLARLRAQRKSDVGALGRTLLGADPPEHSSRRRMILPSFTNKRVAGLRPRIQRVVDERLDALAASGPPGDLMTGLALSVPAIVVCELLGVPFEDHAFFEEQSKRRLAADTVEDAIGQLTSYLDNLVTRKEKAPGDALLDQLIANQLHPGHLDREELVALAVIVLVAGHDTTANVIGLGTLALLRNPEQLAALRADPALVPDAVEELLRLASVVEAIPRVTTADIEIGGQVIPAGEGVLIAAAVNHDPLLVDAAEQLNIRRGFRQHLAFGYGIHQCAGANLARAELEIAFTSMLNRFPNLRLAVPPDEVPISRPGPQQRLAALPVTW